MSCQNAKLGKAPPTLCERYETAVQQCFEAISEPEETELQTPHCQSSISEDEQNRVECMTRVWESAECTRMSDAFYAFDEAARCTGVEIDTGTVSDTDSDTDTDDTDDTDDTTEVDTADTGDSSEDGAGCGCDGGAAPAHGFFILFVVAVLGRRRNR